MICRRAANNGQPVVGRCRTEINQPGTVTTNRNVSVAKSAVDHQRKAGSQENEPPKAPPARSRSGNTAYNRTGVGGTYNAYYCFQTNATVDRDVVVSPCSYGGGEIKKNTGTAAAG